MKKLITLVAAVVLGVSTIGCAEKKTGTTTPAPGTTEEKKAGGEAPAEPAPAPTEEKK